MRPRLLIDSPVLVFVGRLKKGDREFLTAWFEQIRNSPATHADYRSSDDSGRPSDVHVAGRFAITYWDDFADRHVKIMDVDWADDVL